MNLYSALCDMAKVKAVMHRHGLASAPLETVPVKARLVQATLRWGARGSLRGLHVWVGQ